MTLPTKIQYNNFEPGEFTGQKDSTYEETIGIIEQFPWAEQRDHLQISLTNPSVTIENREGGSLKLAVYYNDRFVLHYFSPQKQLYTRSFTNYTDTYPYIKIFFDTNSFDPQGFKKEITWGLHPSLHLTEQDFHYTLKFRRCWGNLVPTSLAFLFSIPLMVILLNPHAHGRTPLTILCTIIFLFGILLLSQLINHYNYCRGKVLIVSKGTDTFYFGNRENPRVFKKTNIMDIVTYGTKDKYGSYDSFAAKVDINFIDGSTINISTMLIQHSVLLGKLAGYTTVDEQKFLPFIFPSSSAPS